MTLCSNDADGRCNICRSPRALACPCRELGGIRPDSCCWPPTCPACLPTRGEKCHLQLLRIFAHFFSHSSPGQEHLVLSAVAKEAVLLSEKYHLCQSCLMHVQRMLVHTQKDAFAFLATTSKALDACLCSHGAEGLVIQTDLSKSSPIFFVHFVLKMKGSWSSCILTSGITLLWIVCVRKPRYHPVSIPIIIHLGVLRVSVGYCNDIRQTAHRAASSCFVSVC